jgi:hypothetical protein
MAARPFALCPEGHPGGRQSRLGVSPKNNPKGAVCHPVDLAQPDHAVARGSTKDQTQQRCQAGAPRRGVIARREVDGMADSTTGPCQTNPATKPGPAIPETCPSGEEPPEAKTPGKANASGPRYQWSHEPPTITPTKPPRQERLDFADPLGRSAWIHRWVCRVVWQCDVIWQVEPRCAGAGRCTPGAHPQGACHERRFRDMRHAPKGAFLTLNVPKAPFKTPAMSQTRLSGHQPRRPTTPYRGDHRWIQVQCPEGHPWDIGCGGAGVTPRLPSRDPVFTFLAWSGLFRWLAG